MDANRLALIFVFFTNIFLGSFVHLKGKRNVVNISFNVLTSTIALWILSVYMISSVWQHENPILWVRRAYAVGTFTIASFVVFSVIFRHENMKIARKYIYIIFPIALILAIISLSPFSIRKIDWEYGVIVKTYYGTGNRLWATYAAICWLLIFHNLASKWRSGSGIEKLRLQYMFLGIVFTLTVIGLTNIFIPLLLDRPDAVLYGPCFTMIMVAFIAYAIVKHRLMNIAVFIRKGIVYSLLLAVATLVGALLLVAVPHIFPDLSRGQSILVSLLGGAFLLFVLKPFSIYLKDTFDSLIFKDLQHSRQLLGEFNHLATKTLDLEGLLNLIFDTAVEAMKVDRASLWLADPGMERYTPTLLLGLKQDDLQVDLSAGSGIVYFLEKNHGPVVRDELEKELSLEDFDRIETDFRKLKAEISLPLFAEDQLIGILNLGNKASGRIYYEEDVNLLKAIADQSSIGIQNAKLHQQVVNMKNYNEAILENLTSGVIAVDSSSKITTVNRAAAKILGVAAEDSIEITINSLPKYMRDLLVKTLESGFDFRDIETKITMVDGKEEKTILISTTVLKDEKDQITGSIAVFSDITVLKNIEEEIRQTEKLSSLGRLAAELAHEIKNPLVTIKTFFQLMIENQYKDGVDKDFLNLALSETDRINELIRRLLDLTRPSPPKFEWCNINQILDDTILILRSDMKDRSIEFTDLRSSSLNEIYADRDQLKQVFLNIGMNALDAMENGGKLTIETYMRSGPKLPVSGQRSSTRHSSPDSNADALNDHVVIRISDTGKGISKDELDKIYEPFYTTKTTGTGLGLAVVNNIVRGHSGSINAVSSEETGTIFTIEFPLIGEKAEEMMISELSSLGTQSSTDGNSTFTRP